MKHLLALLAAALVAQIAFGDSGPPKIDPAFTRYSFSQPAFIEIPKIEFVPKFFQLPPPPATYNVEAIYDRDSKSAAVGASAFWKRFTRKERFIDVHFFGGLDKAQIPVAAILGKFTWSPADQLTLSFGPAFEWKQGKTLGLTLFVGASLK